MIREQHHFGNISIEHINLDFKQAYLEIYGLNHLRPSYTAWVFFGKNLPLPKEITPQEDGFAGTMAVFGHSECWGDTGHCHGKDAIRRFDTRPSHPLTRAFKRVPVTQALKNQIRKGKKSLDISIYVYSRMDWPNQDGRSLLCCKGLQLVTR